MSTTPHLPRSTVLLVNDNPDVSEMLAALLRREGYQVVSAANGLRALEFARSIDPDIVISDVVMPEMDGLEFCRQLKQDARTANLPVLLASGVLIDAEDSLHGLLAGADDYIEMPFRHQELLIKVARLVERHRVERRYRGIVEEAADIIGTSDLQGIITGLNEAGVRFYGRPAAELIGQHVSILIGEKAAAEDFAKMQKHASNEPLRSVYRLRDARGSLRCLENVTTIVRDPSGEQTGVRAVVRDITERVSAEEALQESERRLSTLLSNLPGVAYRCRNNHKWTMEFVSDGCYDLTGYTPADLIEDRKLSYGSLIHKDDAARVWTDVQAAVHEHRPYQLTYRIITASGEEKCVWEQGRNVSFDEEIKLEGFITDITEHKQAEKALRDSEEHYRILFESNPHPMWVYDLETLRFLAVNDAAVYYYGYSREEFLSMTIKNIRPPDEIPWMLDKVKGADAGLTYSGQCQHRKKDGTIIDVEITSHQIAFAASHARLVMASDITTRIEVERELRSSEERFFKAFNASPDPMTINRFDDRQYLQVNDSFLRIMGYDRAEVIGHTTLDLNLWADANTRPKLIKKLAEDGKIYKEEVKFRVKSGEVRTGLFSAEIIEIGGERCLLSITNDITERVEAEQRLLASVQQMETLTALATNVNNSREIDELLAGLADSIAASTDYRTCVLGLFTDDPPYNLRLLSRSSNIPPDEIERIIAGSYTPREMRKLIEEGIRIEVGELGFAAYYPPGYHHLLDRAVPERYKTQLEKPLHSEENRWHEDDELFVPLVSREGDYIGLISLDDPRSGRAPDHGSVLPIVALARQIAQLLAQQEAAEALEQQAGREALINRISGAVRRSLDVGEIFRTAVAELGSHLNVDRCSLFILDEQAGVVRQAAEYCAPGVRTVGRDYTINSVGDLIAGIRQHGTLLFHDVSTDERIKAVYDKVLRANGVRSTMYAGIRVGDETPAAFAISMTRQLRHWRESDVALIKAVADQTGIAIRQAELYQKAASTSAREALINRLSLAIRASLSLPEVLRTATHELGAALQASRVYLRLYDAARPISPVEHEYIAPHIASVRHVDGSYDDPIGQRLLRSMQPIVIDDAKHYAEGTKEFNTHLRAHAAATSLRSSIYYPVIVNNRYRATLCIHQTDRARHWLEDEIALVESVAAQLATGVAQAELYEITKLAKKEWETTFNAMSDGIYIFDNSGRLARVNRAGAAFEDTWPHLLLGRHCCDILRSGNDEQTCVVERAFAENRSVTIEVTPERINRPLLVTVEPIVSDESKTIGVVCTARDMSELRKAEAVARERQTLLTNILESARESIFALDTHGYYQWCNEATAKMSGYTLEELVGQHYLDVVLPADRERIKEAFESALHGVPQTEEMSYIGRDGNLHYSLVDKAPLIVDGRTTGVLGIARDITEQKQERERAAQADKLRALGQLASGVAHDFNNALAAILGRVQLVRRNAHDEALTHNLNIIQTAAEDAAATVRRIQTFARQSQTEEFESLAVDSLLRDAAEITRTRWENEARARGLHYDVVLDLQPEMHALGSASELREVFVNLIVNAVDAMPQGGRLSITCAKSADQVRLLFKDTGTGMTEDVRARIFEPFYTTKGMHGTGLGLAVSYGIIERHHGRIRAESEIGSGTTFEIELPFVAPVPQAAKQSEVRHQENLPLSVLVIDDEAFVRETLGEMLEVLSHKVVTAGSGREALELLAVQSFDLIFTDLSMPEMDGWEVAREIRRRRMETSIVLVTGYGKGTTPPAGEENLIDGIIGKPFDFTQVEETIAKVTGKQESIAD